VPTDPSPQFPEPEPARNSLIAHRAVALIEVLICADLFTQRAIGGTLAAFGYQALVNGRLNLVYVVILSLADAILLIALILLILRSHGERPREVLFGRHSIGRDIIIGLPLIAAALALGAAVMLSIQRWLPSLHTVATNPLQELLSSPRDAWWFALVVVAAGGVREEIQRAFLLHRFNVWLGGPAVGLAITSIAFGAGHLLQGVDATIATGILGAFWGAIYLGRRSCVAAIVSHSGFDLVQIGLFLAIGR
jgi:membrane protease YdiL (CAAX protease family)